MSTDYFEPDTAAAWVSSKLNTLLGHTLFSIIKHNYRLHYDIWMNELHNDGWFAEWSMLSEIHGMLLPTYVRCTDREAVLNCKQMCAYGALCVAQYKTTPNYNPTKDGVILYLGEEHNITDKNDVERKSFIEIAEYVEKNVQVEG